MRKLIFFIFLSSLISNILPQANLSIESSAKWISLFNGKDLSGWHLFSSSREKSESEKLNFNKMPIVNVENGIIHFYKYFNENEIVPEGFLFTENDYENFHLKLEFKWGEKKFKQRINKKRNSGLMFYAQDTIGFWPTSVECQIMEGSVGDIYTQNNTWISTTIDTFIYDPIAKKNFPHYSKDGRIYNHGGKGSNRLMHKQSYDVLDDWNKVEIIAKEGKVKFIVNGNEVSELWNIRFIDPANKDFIMPLTHGKILLQAEATEIFFRNIFIKEL